MKERSLTFAERTREFPGLFAFLILALAFATLTSCSRAESKTSHDVKQQEKVGELPENEARRLAEKDDFDGCHLDYDLEDVPFPYSDLERPYDERISFAVKFNDEVSPHRLISTSVMPGEDLTLEAVLTDENVALVAGSDGGSLERIDRDEWKWTAPDEPGSVTCIQISDAREDETICVHVFVMVPWDGSSRLNGYRIGDYQKEALRGKPEYELPRGFIEVTEENRDQWVSPHFQLKQFLCKQQSDYPKYVLLDTRLLLKLELLLEEFNEAGIEAETFFVMSGYRTPHYNFAIGNRTAYSRHLYGDAADIFIDDDRDGVMDDVTGDGRVTRQDARALYNVVNSLTDDIWYKPFIGGMGLYGPAPHRGPFIHVDTRGYRARW